MRAPAPAWQWALCRHLGWGVGEEALGSHSPHGSAAGPGSWEGSEPGALHLQTSETLTALLGAWRGLRPFRRATRQRVQRP